MILTLSFIFLSNLPRFNIPNSFINLTKLLIIINTKIVKAFYRLALNKNYNNNLFLKVTGLLEVSIYIKVKFS